MLSGPERDRLRALPPLPLSPDLVQRAMEVGRSLDALSCDLMPAHEARTAALMQGLVSHGEPPPPKLLPPPQRAPEAPPAPVEGKRGNRPKRVSCNAQMLALYEKDPMVYLQTWRWFAEQTGYSVGWVYRQPARKKFTEMREDDANGRVDREQTKRSHDEWQQAIDDALDGEA